MMISLVLSLSRLSNHYSFLAIFFFNIGEHDSCRFLNKIILKISQYQEKMENYSETNKYPPGWDCKYDQNTGKW